jgi:hypothetical protein
MSFQNIDLFNCDPNIAGGNARSDAQASIDASAGHRSQARPGREPETLETYADRGTEIAWIIESITTLEAIADAARKSMTIESRDRYGMHSMVYSACKELRFANV